MFFSLVEWFTSNMFFFWLVVSIIFLILEMWVIGLFFFLSFSMGAFVCAFSTFFTNNLILQSLFFLVATVIAFLLLHFLVKGKWIRGYKEYPSNVYALEGKIGMVIRQISNTSPGLVKVFGETWAARTVRGEFIAEGNQVKIIQVKGVHLIVQKLEK